MNTTILSTLTGTTVNNPRDVIFQGYSGNVSENAGCWIKSQSVMSIYSGNVLSVDRSPDNSSWSVTVEVNPRCWIRYCNLSGTNVIVGNILKEKDSIGYAYNNLMRFEYCTSSTSQFPVRIGVKQLYKHDPTPVLFGQLPLTSGV